MSKYSNYDVATGQIQPAYLQNCTLHSLRHNNRKILGYVRQVSGVDNIHLQRKTTPYGK
jgi:hypothetical protein